MSESSLEESLKLTLFALHNTLLLLCILSLFLEATAIWILRLNLFFL